MDSVLYVQIKSELGDLGISTSPEVANFRVPGERVNNVKSPTAGNMFTVLENLKSHFGMVNISRRRVRSLTLRALREGAL